MLFIFKSEDVTININITLVAVALHVKEFIEGITGTVYISTASTVSITMFQFYTAG